VADTVYSDCPRNKDGEPVRADQLKRFQENLCVYCEVQASQDHHLDCPEKWEKELSVYGLSRKDMTRDDARAFAGSANDNEEGDEVGYLAQQDLTGAYRFRSSRERNFAKRDIPSWARNDATLFVLMNRYDVSRKRALQTFRAVHEKWRSREKIRASRKDHARLRKCLERLRKDADALKQELVETGLTPEHVDAYLRDPTLKRLLYPEKIEPQYSSEVLKIVLRVIDETPIRAGHEDAREQIRREAVQDWMRSMSAENWNKVWEMRPDRCPSDPSSADLAKLLGLTTNKSDTSE
jgi:hypothetical protein